MAEEEEVDEAAVAVVISALSMSALQMVVISLRPTKKLIVMEFDINFRQVVSCLA